MLSKNIRKCCVLNCKITSLNKEIIFHRLPKYPEEIRKEWIRRLGISKVTSCTFVCSLHFKEDDYFPCIKFIILNL